jgi:hypothetical protein
MSAVQHKFSARIRLIAVGILIVIGLLLAAAIGLRDVGTSPSGDQINFHLDTAVKTVLVQFGIDEQSVRNRSITSASGSFVRMEKRILVKPDFPTLGFNRALREAVAERGASVVASEKSDDKSVTLHVKTNGAIVLSIVLIAKKAQQ